MALLFLRIESKPLFLKHQRGSFFISSINMSDNNNNIISDLEHTAHKLWVAAASATQKATVATYKLTEARIAEGIPAEGVKRTRKRADAPAANGEATAQPAAEKKVKPAPSAAGGAATKKPKQKKESKGAESPAAAAAAESACSGNFRDATPCPTKSKADSKTKDATGAWHHTCFTCKKAIQSAARAEKRAAKKNATSAAAPAGAAAEEDGGSDE